MAEDTKEHTQDEPRLDDTKAVPSPADSTTHDVEADAAEQLDKDELRSDRALEEDIEPATEPPTERQDLVASEDFSVFTVPQKRAIILAGSFIGWFSPMSGSIYYPALNEVNSFHCISICLLKFHRLRKISTLQARRSTSPLRRI